MNKISYLRRVSNSLRSSKLWYAFCWVPVLFSIVLSIEFLFEDVPMLYKPILWVIFMIGGCVTTYVWAIAVTLLQKKSLPGAKFILEKIIVALSFFYSVTLPFFGFSGIMVPSEFDLGILLISMLIIVIIGERSPKPITYKVLKNRLLLKTEDY